MGTIVRIVGSLVGGYHLCRGGGGRCKQPIEENEDIDLDYLTPSPKLRSRLFEILETISIVIILPKVNDLPPIKKVH